MSINLSKLRPFFLHPFKSDHDLIDAIEELSENFTKERKKITDYLKDPRLVSAYAAFYLTTNVPKLAEVFKWLPLTWLQEIQRCDFIDLGAGPGTFSVAFQEWAQDQKLTLEGAFIQLETSALMREQAQKIWEGLYGKKAMFQSSIWNKKGDRPRFLCLGHSANEMGAAKTLAWIKEINPDHILFIEPGTKDFFPVMLEIRKALLDQGHHIVFPCPHEEECPLKNHREDWCHQFILTQQDPEIQRLSQMAKKDRRLLPVTVHAFSKTKLKPESHDRVIRVFPETKFSFEWQVCTPKGIEHYQVMKRALEKQALKDLGLLLAGASIQIVIDKPLEKSKRVKLLAVNNKLLDS